MLALVNITGCCYTVRYALECVHCGVIYRSYQHWFGNIDPDRSSLVVTKVYHVWPGVSVGHFCTVNGCSQLHHL